MRDTTTHHYVMTVVCLLAFFLRIELQRVPFGNPVITLSTSISNSTVVLLNALRGNAANESLPLQVAIHRQIMSILQEPRAQGTGSSLPSIATLFIIFRNTMPSGMIKHPEYISGTLSELKWTLRATSFWDIVLKLKEITDSDAEFEEGDSSTLR
jgi:hypothetical protein